MRSAAFDGQNRVARSRAVHAVLREELETRVHALALELSGTGVSPG
jgi:stress-induced morphogen